ncbi:MAG TPA: retropepsin-like aspartic protease, partial [Rhizomicrobium sp.]|nr:retropepsin-like aspartic protease [Rhizomicrobium sp.]
MRAVAVWALALLTLALPLAAQYPTPAAVSDLDALYQSNQWPEFTRALARSPNAPPFYRGVLALAVHDWPQSEKQFQSAMKPGGDPLHSFEAAMGLMRIYELTGRRKDARALLSRLEQTMRSLRGARAIDPAVMRSFRSYRAQMDAAGDYPDQSIAARGLSRVLYAQIENQLIVPLKINGAPANYVIDTGSEQCLLSVSEAHRLGLAVRPLEMGVSGFGPDSITNGITIAPDLVIGNFHLRNVLFLVQRDGDAPAGIIGMPVLLALETIRWSSDGTIEFGFPAAPRAADSNLWFSENLLLTRAELDGKSLMLGLDTGDYESILFPRFSRDFPDTLKPFPLGKREAPRDTSAVALANLRLGGQRIPIAPIPLYAREPIDDATDLHGWLGMDLLSQGRSVTLDFDAMKLTLDGIDRPTAAECPLPSGFHCLPGFDCIVKQPGTAPCFIERIPSTAPAGNPVTSPKSDSPACHLPENAQCAGGALCSVDFDSPQTCHITESSPEPSTGADARVSAVAENKVPAVPPSAGQPAAGPPDVDVRELLRRSVKYESLDLGPPHDYIYQEEEEKKLLNPDGSVKTVTRTTREVMNLYDAQFTRLIRKDGQDLPPDKARSEQAHFDKAVEKRRREQASETPQAKAKREETERKRDAENLLCDDEFVRMFDAHISGSEEIAGRPSWIVDLTPRASAPEPRCHNLKVLTRFSFKLWIDKAEARWARFEGVNIAPVTWMSVLVRVPAQDLHISFETARHADGLWLQSEMHWRISGKLLLAARFRIDDRTTYSNYRKFQADS